MTGVIGVGSDILGSFAAGMALGLYTGLANARAGAFFPGLFNLSLSIPATPHLTMSEYLTGGPDEGGQKR
jgi:hypothetical protein